MHKVKFTEGNLQLLMSSMENWGYYLDHRLKDTNFVMNLYKKYKVPIKSAHMYICDDETINKMLPDFTKAFDTVTTQEAFR
jgi:hypothetical protein